MKPVQDDIDWSVVHRSQEGNPTPDADAFNRTFWRQRLRNLEDREVAGSDSLRLTYTRELEAIEPQVDKLN
jgi:hypothetical protein